MLIRIGFGLIEERLTGFCLGATGLTIDAVRCDGLTTLGSGTPLLFSGTLFWREARAMSSGIDSCVLLLLRQLTGIDHARLDGPNSRRSRRARSTSEPTRTSLARARSTAY